MTPAPALDLSTPEQLRDLLGQDWCHSGEQFAVITAPLEPAVVIAGAGSGKTSVMAARVVWLVATGRVEPNQILGLTFTTKATAELQSRIRDSLRRAGLLPEPGGRSGDEEVEEPTVATYHSYASGLLTEHGLRLGHEPDTRLIADASRYQLATRVVQRYTRPIEHLSDSPRHVVQYLLGLDAEMSEHLVSPEQVREYDARVRPLFEEGMVGESRKTYRERSEKAILAIDRRAELLGLVGAYRDLKRHHGLMDFSDQIALAARLATECPKVGALEREKFKVVLLDEYQDTSVAQAQMLRLLFSGSSAADGLGHPVTAVGDPNQAIYGWRGASVSNILDFGSDFPSAHGATPIFPLITNRRSDARIIDVANHLAADLYTQTNASARLAAAPGAAPGQVQALVHQTYDDELAWLADTVVATHGELSALHQGPAWNRIGVLTRDNAHAAAVFDALSSREVPVEIVGLKGLLRLPEVSEVVATLALINDVTANAELLTLLAGPRWAVGTRDLALLGQRARELVRAPGAVRGRSAPAGADGAGPGDQGGEDGLGRLADQLADAVLGADPSEVSSLSDALEDPGNGDYSEAARERFGLLAGELRRLRTAVGEPILDLVRRIIEVTGIDVELASSVSPAAAARRDNLDLFVQAVSEFQAVDGQVTLAALLAWLEAEDEFGQGLDVATPSEADSVKLLTVHRAKGLEWDAVFLVGVTERKFPSNRGRSSWLSVSSVLPTDLRGDARDLPALAGHTPSDINALAAASKVHAAREELRLGYVAWTRAKHRLFVSCWRWAPRLKTGAGPSAYLHRTREAIEAWGGAADRWAEVVAKGEPNPYAGASPDLAWPISHHTAEADRRVEAAAWVQAAADERAGRGKDAEDPGLFVEEVDDMLQEMRLQQWDTEIARLVEEAARERSPEVSVPLPSSLSATALAALNTDPDAFARKLARPMPRRPSTAARFGTRFHAWVEARFGQQQLLDPDELSGRGDTDLADEADLAELTTAFEAGAFADRAPYAIEAPFALVLGGQVVRGRIDAVYAEPDGGYLVVDWKTSRSHNADPLQLAVYRLAWAELTGVAPESVRAGFYYVRSGDLVEPEGLAGRAELTGMVHPSTPGH